MKTLRHIAKAGERYNRLTLIKKVGREKSGNARWLCKCDCGTEFETALCNVTSGHTKSCGCLRSEQITKRNNANRNRRS